MYKNILKILFVIGTILVVKTILDNDIDNVKDKFNNGVLLNCNGLIINNQDWKLLDNNLINNNLAGHLNIKTCVEQK